jgi:ribokinase
LIRLLIRARRAVRETASDTAITKRRFRMSRSPPRICVVGSLNTDLTFRTTRLPKPGETLRASEFHIGQGGKGANQAVMAARLGGQVTMIGRVGRDAFGDATLRHITREGIDTVYIKEDVKAPSGTAAIIVDDDARNCILVVPGANGALTPQDVRDAASAIRSARVLLCQLEVPIESVLEAFRIARAAKVRTILNPAPAAPLPDELLQLTDICVPNESEIESLTGRPLATVQTAALELIGRGPLTVLVTMGERGVLIVTKDAYEQVPAVPVHAVDTTGAGDVFIGALAVFLAEERILLEAVRWASAAAALSVTKLGAQASFPSRGDVEGLFLGER